MTVIPIRLRVPLRVKTHRQREHELMFGVEFQPQIIPARTTLRIVDFFTSGAYALTPDDQHVLVSPTTMREHGYTPRRKSIV